MVPRNLRPLLPYFKKYRGGFVLGALCVLLNNGTWVLFPKVIQKAIDGLSHQISYHQLMLYSLLLVGIALTKGVFQFLTRWILIGISREIEFDLRNDLFQHLESLSYPYYQRTRTGDVMARATNDMSAVRNAIGPGLSNGVRTGLMFVIASILMVTINLKLALVVIFFMPLR